MQQEVSALHRRSRVLKNLREKVSVRVLVLYHGKTVESGTLDETIDHPKMDYTRKLIDSVL